MTARDILMAAGGASQEKLYVDDVFSTYLHAGNGSTQTINNGIDLAGKGGLVWIKERGGTSPHLLFDTVRGAGNPLTSSDTTAQNTGGYAGYQNFLSNGFSLGNNGNINGTTSQTYTSWTFRKAPKFFDVVTYTGNGSSRTLSHSLGAQPGMVIVKRTDAASDWFVWHTKFGASPTYGEDKVLYLNTTAETTTLATAFGGTIGSSTFYVGTSLSVSGATYVAYLFAHDPSADGIIQCGSFTTDTGGNATISLGWEPQFVLLKPVSSAGNWVIADSMRGMPVDGADARLYPNLSNSETAANTLDPTATGFNATGLAVSTSYIYMTIRRPNKPPASGRDVYFTQTDYTYIYSGIGAQKTYPVDLAIGRLSKITQSETFVIDRLRGGFIEMPTATINYPYLVANTTAAEAKSTNYQSTLSANFSMVISGGHAGKHWWSFRRAPGFFDVVAYAGDAGFAANFAHNLSAQPELVISKRKDSQNHWAIAVRLGTNSWLTSNATGGFVLNSSAATTQTVGYDLYFTPTHFGPGFVGGGWESTNLIGGKYVAYLFASCPGISKVGSYTGNGGSQTINCGFAMGARFVLIKRTDASGDWYVWDTERGIVSASDPHLSLNSTAAEVTTDDSVDPDASGFIVNQNSATNINVSGGQYIFLAIA